MHVRPETYVIGEIPAGMIGIVVDHDLIGIPEPAIAIGHLSGKHAEVVSTKPEPRWTASRQTPYVFRTEAEREAPVLPGAVEPETRVVATRGMSDPGFAVVDVGSIGVPGSVIEVFRWRLILWRVPHRRGSLGRRTTWGELMFVGGMLLGRTPFGFAPFLSRGTRS